MLIVWWLHQNKSISFCFNTDSFCCLKTFDDLNFRIFVEGAICEPKKINFFFGSDKLLMTEIKSEQANNHVGAWYAMVQSEWKYLWDISWFFFFVGENIDYLNAMKLRGTWP